MTEAFIHSGRTVNKADEVESAELERANGYRVEAQTE
jgi:hypothetical protein